MRTVTIWTFGNRDWIDKSYFFLRTVSVFLIKPFMNCRRNQFFCTILWCIVVPRKIFQRISPMRFIIFHIWRLESYRNTSKKPPSLSYWYVPEKLRLFLSRTHLLYHFINIKMSIYPISANLDLKIKKQFVLIMLRL